MTEMLAQSAFFCMALTLGVYMFGSWLQRRIKSPLCNPLLLSIIVIILVLLTTGIRFESYTQHTELLNFFITPATVCLALPLYRQMALLRRNWVAIVGGIAAGVLASLLSVFAVSRLFQLSFAQYITLLPRSVTTAIGIGVSGELGGVPAITVAAILVTGVFGHMAAAGVLRLLRVTNPVAMGVAIGTSCHVMGTAKAAELGETQGAMSSLAIVVAGLLTVVLAPLFAGLPL